MESAAPRCLSRSYFSYFLHRTSTRVRMSITLMTPTIYCCCCSSSSSSQSWSRLLIVWYSSSSSSLLLLLLRCAFVALRWVAGLKLCSKEDRIFRAWRRYTACVSHHSPLFRAARRRGRFFRNGNLLGCVSKASNHREAHLGYSSLVGTY